MMVPTFITKRVGGEDGLASAVSLVGYLEAEDGIGEVARGYAATLDAASIRFDATVLRTTRSRQQDWFPAAPTSRPGDVGIVCVNADQLRGFARDAGRAFFRGRKTVGAWAWEVDSFPKAMAGAARHVDEVWAISEHAAGAIRARVDRPVYSVPPAVIPRAVPAHAPGASPSGFVFLACADGHSVLRRKNPLGAVQAFVRAFSPGEGPTLVVKAVNAHSDRRGWAAVVTAARSRSDVVLMTEYLDREDHLRLVAGCDAFVSLHRAEGFGLAIAEAMAFGKPAIATGYSGNLEFMDRDNSVLVPYALAPIGRGASPYPARGRWAEPDLDAAADAMRDLVARPTAAAGVGERARRDMIAKHAPAARVALLRRRLCSLSEASP